ncbi:TPA: adenosine deaminase [Staphylococcus aureus]|nr:adenosine deaminase [Staphylococcus aureus]HDD0441413.1 adenosine deaminase [Staphylococcus aureus]HDD0456185.1 adenosine deaminase [Staphylococcus aureus]HDD0590617.1 adenosine deaminase [Staphylococcus aureus]HDD0598782.1 adenosine deaminase [Staphylococcus aureus]
MKSLIRNIPKVELHCHLDGSVSKEYIKWQSLLQNIEIDLNKAEVKSDNKSLEEYLQCFDEILKVMQTTSSIENAVIDVAKQAIKDGIVYIELRFAPLFHIKKGLDVVEVLAAFCKGADYVEKHFDITVRGIICGMKHHSLADNIHLFEYLKEKEEYNNYIVGVDLAGAEEKFPIEIHSKAIQYAKSLGLNITLHAGECNCIKNVYDSISLGAKRIGHGVASFNDDNLLKLLSREKIMLEICPKSNLQTKAIQDIRELDLSKLLLMNVPFIINTDNRTVTNTTLVEEYKLLLDNDLITIEEIELINKKAIDYVFDDEKRFIKLM